MPSKAIFASAFENRYVLPSCTVNRAGSLLNFWPIEIAVAHQPS
jgi:hypothetical protein